MRAEHTSSSRGDEMRYYTIHRTRGRYASHQKAEVSGLDEMIQRLQQTKNFYTNVTMVGLIVDETGNIELLSLDELLANQQKVNAV